MARADVIETDCLRLVPFSEEHLTPRYVSWLNDPDVVRFSEQRFRRHTLESCRAYLRGFEDSPNYFWAIVARDADLEHLGTMTAYIEQPHRVADLGILIGEKRLWGRGYGLEAWRAVCGWLFAQTDVRKITAGTVSVNSGMLALMRRAGMIQDGRRVAQCLHEGREVDVIHTALFRSHSAAR